MSLLEETVNDAQFIFEAVVEDLGVKKDLFESEYFKCWQDSFCLLLDSIFSLKFL